MVSAGTTRGALENKAMKTSASKTEIMSFGTAAGLRKLPAGSGCIYSGVETVEPVSVVRNVGV